MDYRKKWDEIEAAPTDIEMARRVNKLGERTILRMLRWNDRDGVYPSSWSKHELSISLLLQALQYKTNRDYSVAQVETLLRAGGR